MSAVLSRELATLNQSFRVLIEAGSLNEIKAVRDKAEAARTYAKAAQLGLDLQNRAAELKLRAERRAGGFLASLGLRGGDRRSIRHRAVLKLADLGISSDQSKRWQNLASVPEEKFCKYLRSTSEQRREVTSAGLLRVARKSRRGRQSMASGPAGGVTRGHDRKPVSLELLLELMSHCQLLADIIQPMHNGGEHAFKRVERRAVDQLLLEMDELFQQIRKEVTSLRRDGPAPK